MNKISLTTMPVTPFKIISEKVNIYLFGKPYDFSPQGNLEIIIETLKFYAAKNGVMNIFAPSCKKFNAEVVWKESFRQKIRLRGGLTIHKGVFADGVVLENKQEAFFIPSADCPTIVATGKYIVIAAHAGRDCLLDKQKIHTGKISRRNESVVDAIMERCLMAGEFIKDLQVFIICGIKAENFSHPIDHPQYGEKNKTLVKCLLEKYGTDCLRGNLEEVNISLDDLIKKQFTLHGVPPENLRTDCIDTFSDKYSSGEYIWNSRARAKTEKGKKERNGILVIKTF